MCNEACVTSTARRQSLPLITHHSSLITLARASKIVLQAHNVIFAEIAAALDFNENQRLVAGILHAMR